MPTFGFSAYLKLISLSERRQRSEIRSRLYPREGGYDFHRNMRLQANRYAVGAESLSSVLANAHRITNPSERRSAIQAIERVSRWLEQAGVECSNSAPREYDSPRSVFRVRFKPDFRLHHSIPLDVHLWNTANPNLDVRLTYGALGLIRSETEGDGQSDISVLSLRNMNLLRASEVAGAELIGRRTAQAIEEIFIEIADEIRAPRPISEDDIRVV